LHITLGEISSQLIGLVGQIDFNYSVHFNIIQEVKVVKLCHSEVMENSGETEDTSDEGITIRNLRIEEWDAPAKSRAGFNRSQTSESGSGYDSPAPDNEKKHERKHPSQLTFEEVNEQVEKRLQVYCFNFHKCGGNGFLFFLFSVATEKGAFHYCRCQARFKVHSEANSLQS
jgi:hypothetical protein